MQDPVRADLARVSAFARVSNAKSACADSVIQVPFLFIFLISELQFTLVFFIYTSVGPVHIYAQSYLALSRGGSRVHYPRVATIQESVK